MSVKSRITEKDKAASEGEFGAKKRKKGNDVVVSEKSHKKSTS